MEDFIKNIAAQEGWTDATTVSVLASVLDEIAEHVEPNLIQNLILEKAEIDD